MAKKNSHLKIVEQDDSLEEIWKLTRKEIAERARTLRLELETYRERLEGMPFDVVTDDCPHSVDYVDGSYPINLAEAFNPHIAGHYDWLEKALVGNHDVRLCRLKIETADTAFQIGVLAGAIFAGCSDREIDRLERGLVHATVSRPWRVKE